MNSGLKLWEEIQGSGCNHEGRDETSEGIVGRDGSLCRRHCLECVVLGTCCCCRCFIKPERNSP